MQLNDISAMMRSFATPGRPVYSREFLSFWKSLNDDEKKYYATASLV